MYQVNLFEIDPVGLEKENYSKFCQCIFCFFIIISPWKRAWPFVWTKWKHLHPSKDAFVPSLDEIGSVFLEKMIMWKKIKTDRWKTDNRWSGIGILIVCFTSLMRRSQTARPWHFVNGVLCIVISCLLCFCTLLCWRDKTHNEMKLKKNNAGLWTKMLTSTRNGCTSLNS